MTSIQGLPKERVRDSLTPLNAGLAQLVEHLICNQAVVGSNPTAGSTSHKGLLEIVRFNQKCVSHYSHTLRVDPLCSGIATVCTPLFDYRAANA